MELRKTIFRWKKSFLLSMASHCVVHCIHCFCFRTNKTFLWSLAEHRHVCVTTLEITLSEEVCTCDLWNSSLSLSLSFSISLKPTFSGICAWVYVTCKASQQNMGERRTQDDLFRARASLHTPTFLSPSRSGVAAAWRNRGRLQQKNRCLQTDHFLVLEKGFQSYFSLFLQ